MAIPSNFNTWEHLQALLMSIQNRMVTEEFRDVEDLDNITTPRSSLKSACWLRDADTAIITLVKMFLFHVIIKNGSPDEIYALISDLAGNNKSVKRKSYPKVVLFFSNGASDSKTVFGQVAFRIIDPEFNVRTLTKAKQLATKIKSTFGNAGGYVWKKGKTYYSYCEWERGYQFQILAENETAAKELISRTLALQSHAPNWTYFNTITNDNPSESFPDTSSSITILEDTIKEPILRPKVTVKFKYATLTVPPHKPITLFDLSGKRLDALVE